MEVFMGKVWFRVGMESKISKSEILLLSKKDKTRKEKTRAQKLMRKIIKRATLSGETYILGQEESDLQGYDNPPNEIVFYF